MLSIDKGNLFPTSNFYLSVLDDRLRHPTDQPSIGMILCKSKDKLVVEYSLRDISKPMGVSAYDLTESLPKKLKGSIPTMKELEEEIFQSKDGGKAGMKRR